MSKIVVNSIPVNSRKNWLPPKQFRHIFSKVPRLCVNIVIITDEGILLTKRGIPPNKGYWHIPGGGVLKDESLKDAVGRVAKSELNIEVKITKLLGVVEFLEPSPHHHSVALSHQVEIVGGSITETVQNHGFKFFQSLPSNIEPEHKHFILDQKLVKPVK